MMSELGVEVIAVPPVSKAETKKGHQIIINNFDHKVSKKKTKVKKVRDLKG